MKPHHEMRLALNVLRGAQSLAVDRVRQHFPNLYALSARAFENTEPGSTGHHKRLAEYLTEWNNYLGKLPIEALALGCSTGVYDDLADRASIAPAPYDEVETCEPEQQPIDENHGAYMATCEYFATGEGVSLFVGVASSREGATGTFLQNTPDYFHRGMKVESVSSVGSPDASQLIKLIPQSVLDIIASNPPSTTTYYATLHYNLA